MCWNLTVSFYLTELPLEPSLARTLIEANKYDCLPQALTVAAMLSVEGTLLPGRRYTSEHVCLNSLALKKDIS